MDVARLAHGAGAPCLPCAVQTGFLPGTVGQSQGALGEEWGLSDCLPSPSQSWEELGL